MIKQEQDQTPLKIVVEQVDEIQMILTRCKTKAMAKVEVIQPDITCATTNLPMKMVQISIQKTQGPVCPEWSVLIKWAYWTGTTNQNEDNYNVYKMWEAHCDNLVANFIWRGEVMQPAHTHAPLVPSAEETKLCSTVVSTNAI
jgi:hypothetical protein